MANNNIHGLSRYIPSEIQREVRQRSKFGCVICRCGFYTYEHIEPTFQDAFRHDPDRICCLCGSCQLAVTRGQLSKEFVFSKYTEIQSSKDVSAPTGPLDFHDGTAELYVGGLIYRPAVNTILRYHGIDIIRVDPSADKNPGRISAVFTDHQGNATLRLIDNQWVGSMDAWDIDIEGSRISVRRKPGDIVLRLRLEPPGRIVIERLDMRFRSAHVMISEESYVVGRYISDTSAVWLHANINITRSLQGGAAIELTDAEALDTRDIFLRGTGQEFATHDRNMVIHSLGGVMLKSVGIAIASLTGAFACGEVASGMREVADVRRVIFGDPSNLCQFLGTGSVG